MRIGALLLVGIGFVSAAACTATTSPDEVCISAGGVCVASGDLATCGEQQAAFPCSTGYTCCTPAEAGVDGSSQGLPKNSCAIDQIGKSCKTAGASFNQTGVCSSATCQDGYLGCALCEVPGSDAATGG